MVFALTLIKRGHIFNNATSIPAELRAALFQLQHPLFLSLNPQLADKDIIERDIPLGGTHWSSVPNPNMTSWIQMAKAGKQAGSWGARRKKEVGWRGTKVLVEITSSTPAPRSIATTEVKAPWGEGEEGGGGEEEEVEDEQ